MLRDRGGSCVEAKREARGLHVALLGDLAVITMRKRDEEDVMVQVS